MIQLVFLLLLSMVYASPPLSSPSRACLVSHKTQLIPSPIRIRYRARNGRHAGRTYAAGTASRDLCLTPIAEQILFIPSFIPAIKSCISLHDPACYEIVLNQFSEQLQNERWRMMQLAALVVEFGAQPIWKLISPQLEKSTPQYQLLLARSQARHGKPITDNEYSQNGAFSSRSELQITYQSHDLSWKLASLYLNVKNAPVSISNIVRRDVEPDRFLSTFGPFRDVLEEQPKPMFDTRNDLNNLFSKKAHVLPQYIRTGMKNAPTIFDILDVLEDDSIQAKQKDELLGDLKNRFEVTLAEPVYLLDDMIGSATNMFLLWFVYHDSHQEEIRHFIQFLIDAGAPISDRVVMMEYLKFKQYVGDRSDLVQRYEEMVKMAVTYSTGTPEASLSRLLTKYHSHSWTLSNMIEGSHQNLANVVKGYLEIFYQIDLTNSMVIQSLAHFVYFQMNQAIGDSGHQADATIDIFAGHGLQDSHIRKAIQQVELEYPDGSPEKDQLYKGLLYIAHRIGS